MQFGKFYVQAGGKCDQSNVHMDRLRNFIKTGTIPASRRKRNISLTDHQLAELFTLNLALSALHSCQAIPGLSEESADALSVSSLIQFPPVEGGPLSYAARISRTNLLSMYDKYTKVVPFLVDLNGARDPRSSLLSENNFNGLFNAERVPLKGPLDEEEEGLAELFKRQRSEVTLLSQSELNRVGRSHGVQSGVVFLLPLLLFLVILALLCSLWSALVTMWLIVY